MSDLAGLVHSDDDVHVIKQPAPANLVIIGEGGRALLTIHPDGSVDGEIEDASEAARAFVQAIREML